jgi:hypothetical protein
LKNKEFAAEEFTAEDAKNAKQSSIYFATFALFAVNAG